MHMPHMSTAICPQNERGNIPMDRKEMRHLLIEALSTKLGDGFIITINEVLKNNFKSDALTIMRKGDNIAPAIYLEPCYRELENGAGIDSITEKILEALSSVPENILGNISGCVSGGRLGNRSGSISGCIDIRPYLELEKVRDKLFVELINASLNRELLDDVPHMPFLDDFAVIIRCITLGDTDTDGNTDGTTDGTTVTSFIVHNSLLKLWGADFNELLPVAVQNMRRLFGIELKSMDEVIAELMSDMQTPTKPNTTESNSNMDMWVLSNRNKVFGASVILFDDVLKDFAEKHGSFIIIFSSVHEALLIPSADDSDIDEITQVNQEINADQLLAEEVLGTHAYYYEKGKGFCKNKNL